MVLGIRIEVGVKVDIFLLVLGSIFVRLSFPLEFLSKFLAVAIVGDRVLNRVPCLLFVEEMRMRFLNKVFSVFFVI